VKTIEIPDELFSKTEATAASRGETLREFVNEALTIRLASTSPATSHQTGWRSVFGLADAEMVESVDKLLAEEFEQVDPSEWR
jgi:hypothetical protein